MTSLLVMGMIIARAANGFPPELVLVSQPVLTYNANSVTIYYDVQNIGDVCIYLDPDDGYCYASEWVKVCPGRIKRIAISIPAYRPNPSWTYTVMPYYELGDELYSFTTFEYFEPVRFCWYGYRNEPWVVITVGPRIRYYNRPGDFRFYYDGYRPPMPPPPGHGPGPGPGHPHPMPTMDPHHHTYGYHHTNGGYPANYHPDHVMPGYNHSTDSNGGGATVHPHATGTPGSMSSNNAGNNGGSNSSSSSATVRPNGTSGSSSSNSSSSSSSSSATVRPSGNNSGSSSSSVRPSGNSNSGSSSSSSSSVRPSGNSSSSSSSGRPSSSGNSNVSRPSSTNSSSSSGRTGTTSSSSRTSSSSSSSSSSGRSGNSSSSSSSRGSSSTGGRR